MAQHRSAKKRIRQTVKRTAINRARSSRIRTYIKKVEQALASGDREAAEGALRVAEPEIRRGVGKGVLKLNTASRRISRLARKVNRLGSGGGSETGAGEQAQS
ncbi:MAG TPA: 30S ribosomal protein S20 [Geminicoccaceae bacterium]|nr:30S ribosomal protein S20 [Geminicoccaceae bacterium]